MMENAMCLKMAKISTLSLAAAVTLVSASLAHAFDDPAIAVCEYTQFRGKTPENAGYRRMSAELLGVRVHLTYERSVLNTKPKQSTIECFFVENIAGDFVLARPINQDPASSEVVACRKTISDGEEKIRKGNLDAGETAIVRTSMSMCDRVLGKSPGIEATMDAIDAELTQLGIYPISTGDTGLHQNN